MRVGPQYVLAARGYGTLEVGCPIFTAIKSGPCGRKVVKQLALCRLDRARARRGAGERNLARIAPVSVLWPEEIGPAGMESSESIFLTSSASGMPVAGGMQSGGEIPAKPAPVVSLGRAGLRRRGEFPMVSQTMLKQRTGKQNGFSLIELLIVVAIILIIAAIAIPNLLRAKMAANEASAVASLRTINTAMITYQSSYPTVGYATTLSNLGGVSPCAPSSTTACLIDSVLASGVKSGYNFTATGSGGPPSVQYYATAIPTAVNQTGIRSFCSFEDAVVRVQPTGTGIPSEAACESLLPLNQ